MAEVYIYGVLSAYSHYNVCCCCCYWNGGGLVNVSAGALSGGARGGVGHVLLCALLKCKVSESREFTSTLAYYMKYIRQIYVYERMCECM